jgi:hypothetical protein
VQHYCRLRGQVMDATLPTLNGQAKHNPMFKQLSLERWLKQQKLQLSYCDRHFVPSDLRKFCEEQGDLLQWDQSELHTYARRLRSELAVP